MSPMLAGSLCTVLGIKPGSKVSILNPPRGFASHLNPLPEGVEFLVTAASGLDVVLLFTREPKELVERLPALTRALAVTGGLWVCWPKGPGIRTDLSEELVRQVALDMGLVDNKRATVLDSPEETWLGLRLVYRPRGRPEKPGEGRAKAGPSAEA